MPSSDIAFWFCSTSVSSSSITMTDLEGGCPCRRIRYELLEEPMWVHCCHCTWCQKETGTAFALNLFMESSNVQLLSKDEPENIDIPSESGQGQKMARCPSCRICVWSHYNDTGDGIRFVRAGTLDKPGQIRPSIHIYTSTKLPWLQLNDDVPVVAEYYDRKEIWPKDQLVRYNRARFGHD